MEFHFKSKYDRHMNTSKHVTWPLLGLSVDLFKFVEKPVTNLTTGNFNVLHSHCRATPVEVLHTLLLGSSKYLLKGFMARRSSQEKKEILARITADQPGFFVRMYGNVCYYHNLFVRHDYKDECRWQCLSFLPICHRRKEQCGVYFPR